MEHTQRTITESDSFCDAVNLLIQMEWERQRNTKKKREENWAARVRTIFPFDILMVL